jgi:glycerophosphoryl diester phosphodiesterase
VSATGPGPSRPRLYAHRGAAAEAPENTLDSFARALAHGADALEMDVHLTRDGVVVVSHDPGGARMCGVARRFADANWDEVRRWDAGWGFLAPDGSRPFAGRGLRVPRLEEVLAAFPHVPLNLDLKTHTPSMPPVAVAVLRRARAEERVCLASFSSTTLGRVRALGWRGPLSLGSREVATLLAIPRALQRGPLRPRATRAQLPTRLGRSWVIERCRALGLAVDYWTVNDPAEAARLVALGVDGIMTDDPARIAPVVKAGEGRRGSAGS